MKRGEFPQQCAVRYRKLKFFKSMPKILFFLEKGYELRGRSENQSTSSVAEGFSIFLSILCAK